MQTQKFNRALAIEVLGVFNGVYMCTLGEAMFFGANLKEAHQRAIEEVEKEEDEWDEGSWHEPCAAGIYVPATSVGEVVMMNPKNVLKYLYGSGEITPELSYARKYGIVPPANVEIGVDENEWVVAYTSHSGKLYVIRQLDSNNFQIIYPANSSVAGGIEDAVKWENVNWEKVKVAVSKIKAVCSIFGDVYMLLVARYLASWESLEQAHKMALRKTRACEEPYGV